MQNTKHQNPKSQIVSRHAQHTPHWHYIFQLSGQTGVYSWLHSPHCLLYRQVHYTEPVVEKLERRCGTSMLFPKRGGPQTPSAEDKNDLTNDDYICIVTRHHNVLVCYSLPMSQPMSLLRPKHVSLSGHRLALILSLQSSLLPRTTRRPKTMAPFFHCLQGYGTIFLVSVLALDLTWFGLLVVSC